MNNDLYINDLIEKKKEQRRLCLAARAALSPDERRLADREICRRLTELPEVREASVIFTYSALGDEACLSAFHDWALARDIRLAFPISHKGGRMEAALPASYDDEGFALGAYGILAPKEKTARILSPEEIELVLVPCVGFDKRGQRLGHGAGYYDRYLPQCKKAKAILIAYAAQELETVAVEETDCPMDLLVTEKATVVL